MLDPPDGCRFAPRCPHAVEDCEIGDQPPMEAASGQDHEVSCVYYQEGYDEAALEEVADLSAPESARTDGGKR